MPGNALKSRGEIPSVIGAMDNELVTFKRELAVIGYFLPPKSFANRPGSFGSF